MPLLCCDVGLVSELRLTAGCVLMDLASPAVSGTSVYANGLRDKHYPACSLYVSLNQSGGNTYFPSHPPLYAFSHPLKEC